MQRQLIKCAVWFNFALFLRGISAVGKNAQDSRTDPGINGYFPEQQVLATLV